MKIEPIASGQCGMGFSIFRDGDPLKALQQGFSFHMNVGECQLMH
jgi:hypothetical protein